MSCYRFDSTLLSCLVLFLSCAVSSLAPARAVNLEDTRMLSHPAVSAEHIAFAYAGDLWVAQRDGSGVRRLTSDFGDELSPRFSPDGQTIAFTGEYDGNVDVFLVPTAGGTPTRLTYHPGQDVVQDFTPDGSAVLFASQRESFTNRYLQLFTVPTEGGFPTRLPIPNGLRASYSPDGKKIAYIPIPERMNQWKNYRGGTVARIFIYDTGDHSVQVVPQPEGRSNDTDPVWLGGEVYFRSDRSGEFNLFSFEPASETIEQHTFFEDFPINRVTSSTTDALIFEQAGYLHLFQANGNRPERLKIGVSADLIETRPRWVKGPEWIRSADLSPSGARAVLEYRGEILTLPARKGDARNLTSSTGVHERSPVWSPDGQSIAYFSDEGGEYRLHIAPQSGAGDVRTLDLGGHGFYFDPRWSPDSKKLSFTDNSQALYWIDLASGKVTEIAAEPHYQPGMAGPPHSWSPDSRWIAYSVNSEAYIQRVWVHDTVQGTSHPITDGLSEVSDPVFDRGGKYLYFFASTDAGPVKHWFAMSNADMELNNAVYVAVLPSDEPSPLAPESDEEEPGDAEKETDPEGEGEGKDEKKSDDPADENGDESPTQEVAVRIDFDGLEQRIVALPIPSGPLTDLAAGAAGKVFFIERGRGGAPSALKTFDFETREITDLLTGASGYELSANGKKLLYVAGPAWGIADAGGKIDTGETALPIDKLQVKIDPRAEWAQIFDEAWRINRDFFYDPGMHGADWQAMGEKYQVFLDDITTREDLNTLLTWMSSELAVGHHRNGGGDSREETEEIPGGLLGADFEVDSGRYRFAKVFGGLNWNPEMRAPLTAPGVSVREGEYLIAVNGVDLSASDNVYRRFENTADKIVRLTVAATADGTGSRDVDVVPIASEYALRNRDWVEGNLRKVTEATDGRVAYVYVPNTTNQGHEYFKRYFFPQSNREAIIVDERFNGGGQIADYYIDILRRPYMSSWATRYGEDIVTPSAAIFGPKVMLIDETAGSGGDMLPWMFHKLGLGTLIGKRTWGGLVGVLGFPVLLDGGFITAPNLAIWTEDGFVVENVGVPPDIEVEQWPADVIEGRDPQLEKAIEVVLRQLEENPPPSRERPPFPIRVRK